MDPVCLFLNIISVIVINLLNFRKHRLVKPVTGLDVHKKLRDFQREEQNMFYLRHPYLTPVNIHIIIINNIINQTIHNYSKSLAVIQRHKVVLKNG